MGDFQAEENLSVIGRVLFDLTTASEQSRLGLEGLGQNGYSFKDNLWCPHRFPAWVVFEEPPHFHRCHVDTAKLRQLKRAAGLGVILGFAPDCECVACALC